MKQNNTYKTLLALAAFIALSACAAENHPTIPLDHHTMAMEQRLATEANIAIKSGKMEDALAKFERLWNNASTRDTTVALNYAQLLRKKGYPKKAIQVLKPMVETRRGKANKNAAPILINEMAASIIETGDFSRAQTLLKTVLSNPEATAFYADSHNLQGIIMGAKKDYSSAEKNFRYALNGWKGDATSVKNNLAVCLASQGRFDESLRLLRQALVEAPEKVEIAKNIELISDLRDAIVPMPHSDLLASERN